LSPSSSHHVGLIPVVDMHGLKFILSFGVYSVRCTILKCFTPSCSSTWSRWFKNWCNN